MLDHLTQEIDKNKTKKGEIEEIMEFNYMNNSNNRLRNAVVKYG